MRHLLVLLLLSPSLLLADLPQLTIDKVIDTGAGGTQTRACVVLSGGRKLFLKALGGDFQGYSRYSNVESDILAAALFRKLGVLCPEARLVRLAEPNPLEERLGSTVLAMEFVDTRFARGRIYPGFWPGRRWAAVDEFLSMLLVDILISNTDRRGANFFVTVSYGEEEGNETPGSFRPVPIDNNSGFSSMVNYKYPTNHCGFLETYSGAGEGDVLQDLGTVHNIEIDAPLSGAILGDPELREALVNRAHEVVAALDDGFIGDLVASLPREILPRGITVDPEEYRKLPAKTFEAFFGKMGGKLSGNALFAYRQEEIRRVLTWRRDHLVEALEGYFEWAGKDPSMQELAKYRAEDEARHDDRQSPARKRSRSGSSDGF